MKQHHTQETEKCQSVVHFRSAYGPRLRVGLSCPELPYGRTKQSMKDECDINNIMKKFQTTGLVTFVNEHQPQYSDATSIEFQAAMELVAAADSMFEELPSTWRARFENDPAQFLRFVENPANRAEAIALGLIRPEATPVAAPPGKSPVGASEAPAGDSLGGGKPK